MPTYVDIYDMEANPTLRKQVVVACRKAATDITNEAVGTANHAARLTWAKSVLGNANPPSFDRMIAACGSNATLQAAAPNGPWADSDIQFVVNSNVDAQST